MQYDTATVAMLRTVLGEVLINKAFTDQTYASSVDMAERVLRLAATGEREATVINDYCANCSKRATLPNGCRATGTDEQ